MGLIILRAMIHINDGTASISATLGWTTLLICGQPGTSAGYRPTEVLLDGDGPRVSGGVANSVKSRNTGAVLAAKRDPSRTCFRENFSFISAVLTSRLLP
jgi:hypothetical protein